MTYEEWLQNVPETITHDRVWQLAAYRMAMFLADLAWHDTHNLLQDRRTLSLADQLFRAVGSISANIAEGFSRGSGRDRARFYEYALGSARETRGWYYQGRHVLTKQVTEHRIALVTQIIRLLLSMIVPTRSQTLAENEPIYAAIPLDSSASIPFADETRNT